MSPLISGLRILGHVQSSLCLATIYLEIRRVLRVHTPLHTQSDATLVLDGTTNLRPTYCQDLGSDHRSFPKRSNQLVLQVHPDHHDDHDVARGLVIRALQYVTDSMFSLTDRRCKLCRWTGWLDLSQESDRCSTRSGCVCAIDKGEPMLPC
jgi:hypothetical protein